MGIRLLVADDDPGVRQVIRDFIELCCGDFQIVGEAGDGHAAIELADSCQPDVILMDIRIPGLDGIEATRILREDKGFAARIVTYTSFSMPGIAQRAREAGASAHLNKPFRLEDLGAVLRGTA